MDLESIFSTPVHSRKVVLRYGAKNPFSTASVDREDSACSREVRLYPNYGHDGIGRQMSKRAISVVLCEGLSF
jgi:hypothetical protein